MAFSIRTPAGDHLYSMLVVSIHTKVKARVKKGDLLLTLETAAEKRVAIRSPVDGDILELPLVAGARFAKPMVVVRIEALEESARTRSEPADHSKGQPPRDANRKAKGQRHPDRTDRDRQKNHSKRSGPAIATKAGGFVQDKQVAKSAKVTADTLRRKSSPRPKTKTTATRKGGKTKLLIPAVFVLSIGAITGGWHAGLYNIPALDQMLMKRSKYLSRLANPSHPNQFDTPPAPSERYQRAFEEWMDQ